MAERHLSNEEIRREGMEALLERLGPDGMVRFLQQFDTGKGDYTKDRHRLFAGETVDSLCERMKKAGKK